MLCSLDALRHQGDPLLDEALAAADLAEWDAALQSGGPLPDPLSAIQLPPWADPARLARASRFFLRHAAPASFLLGSASLLECFACARGAKALHAARAMRRAPARRVGETGQFVLRIYAPGAWAAGGEALPLLRRVRVMHAAVRARLGEAGWTGDVPLCQEDQLGTLLAFGLSPLLHLRRLGIPVSAEDVADSLHLWAVAGHALGTRVDRLPRDEAGARALTAAIQARHAVPSREGRELTAGLLGAYAKILGSEAANRAFLALLRDVTGDPLCDLLGVPDPRLGRGGAATRPRRAGRGLAAGLRAWERLRRVPGVDAAAGAAVLPALGLHARRMAGGRARFSAA